MKPTAISALAPVPMLDFRRQYAPMRDEILAAVTQVCDTQGFVLGPEVTRFESAAAQACGTAHGIGCASGTDALWLALAACGIGDSDSALRNPLPPAVITSPFTFFATASAILRAGARPLFADIDPGTFNLSPNSVRSVLQANRLERRPHRVAGILPVHLYGQCANMTALNEIAAENDLAVIEDAAQAFGALWEGRPAGSLGSAAAFSFYPTKNLAAVGEAGLVTTSDDRVAERLRSLRSHGMVRRYYHDEIGWNSRLDSIQAAVLELRLPRLPSWNQERHQLAMRYDNLFQETGLAAPFRLRSTTADGLILPSTDARATHVFHQYVIRAPRRDALRDYLLEHRIGSEIYYPVPLHLQVALRDLGYKYGDFPVAELAAHEVLALPIFPGLTEEEQQTVVEAIRRFYA